jgi:hypothetical protein
VTDTNTQSFAEWATRCFDAALQEATLDGDFIAIVGASGTGKTEFATRAAEGRCGAVIDCLQEAWRANLADALGRNASIIFFDEPVVPGPSGAAIRLEVKKLVRAGVRVVLVVNKSAMVPTQNLLAPFVEVIEEPACAIVVEFDPAVSLLQRDMRAASTRVRAVQ